MKRTVTLFYKKVPRTKYVLSAIFSLIILISAGLLSKEGAFANARHSMLNFRPYNYYQGRDIKSWESAEKIIEEENLILINTPEYEHWEELESCMREEGDDYYDFLLYDYYVEGKRIYIYATQEMVDAFLSTNTEAGRADKSYYFAKVDFRDDLMIIYEYTLGASTGEEGSDNKATEDVSEWGTLVIYGYIDGKAMKNLDRDASASVVIQSEDTGRRYSIELSPNNDFNNAINVEKGHYNIVSAFYGASYPAKVVWDETVLYDDGTSKDTFYIGSYESQVLTATFGDPMTKEEYFAEEVTEENTYIDEAEEIAEEPVEEKSNTGKIIAIVFLSVLGISVIVFVVIVLRKMSKERKENYYRIIK